MAFELLPLEGVPTYILYDRTGVSVWAGHSVAELEDQVAVLLAKGK
jgi:hypothetical protein